jgi:hypothetical protein
MPPRWGRLVPAVVEDARFVVDGRFFADDAAEGRFR